jgi:glycosyltransferase involved in cell wall biosynthesis
MPAAPTGFQLHAEVAGWRWRDAPALRAHIRRLEPDGVLMIYTAWLFDDHPMAGFLPTWLRRWRPGLPVLSLVEIPFPAPPGNLAVRLGRKLAAWWAGGPGVDFGFGTLLRDSSAVAVLGPSVLEDLKPRCAGLGQRALVIPPPPLVRLPADRSQAVREQARARLGAAPGCLLLAYFGYVYAAKGVETLLAALQALRAQGREVRLVMAGGGRGLPGAVDEAHQAFEARMQALAAELGVDRFVAWPPGHAGDSEAMGLDLLAADIAVLPFDDGAELRRSSIAVVTAMSLPLITTRPAREETAFVHDHNCYLCAPRDAAALAAAVVAVADDPARRQRLTAGSQALAHEWFSWSAATTQMIRALQPPPQHRDRAR